MSNEKENEKTQQAAQQPPQAENAPRPLFGIIGYNTPEDFDNFLTKMSKRDAIVALCAHARYSIAKGGLTPEEAECLSKSLRTLAKPDAAAVSPEPGVDAESTTVADEVPAETESNEESTNTEG